VVATTNLFVLQVACILQLSDDPLRSSLGNADAFRDIA
jgi:hypothetical protein